MRNKTRRVHPATLFFLLTIGLIFLVWLMDIYGVSVFNPHTGKYLRVQSLLNAEGARWLMRNSITNFSAFAPVGMVVVSLLGIGVAEDSGFLNALSHQLTRLKWKPRWGLLIMILLGILSNVVGDAGYVFLVPFMALLAPRLGIHPVVAIMVTFVSVACGYSANWMLSSMDPLLARITQDVSSGLTPQNFNSGPYANYFFMFGSTLFLTPVIYWVAKKTLIPKLEEKGMVQELEEFKELAHREKRSLNIAALIGLTFLFLIGWLTFSSLGLFRGVSGELVRSPFIMGALMILSLSLGIMGVVYGLSSGKYKRDVDVVMGLTSGIRVLSIYFVIAFFAAQFFACLTYTQLDQLIVLFFGHLTASVAVDNPTWALLLFIIYCAWVNLIMVSALGKWVLISPIFIPLFWAMGISPDVVQTAFRVGDSATNVVTPFLYYCPFILALLHRYIPRVSFGFIFSNTWKFSVVILIAWALFFLVWFKLGIPFGV